MRRHARGQAIVEFALMVPVLFMLTLGMVDLSRGFWAYVSLQNVAREGARAAIIVSPASSLLTPSSTAPVVARALAEAPLLGLDSGNLTASGGGNTTVANTSFTLTASTNFNNAQALSFSATYTFHPLVSLLIGNGVITMGASSTMHEP